MSLFPAYASAEAEVGKHISTGDTLTTTNYDVEQNVPDFTETQLLASDEESAELSCEQRVRERSPLRSQENFYLDTKLDPGNLWVSTLYYPGRPQYVPRGSGAPQRKPRRARRYFERRAADADDAADAAERATAYRRALADAPRDVHLWTQYIYFQERCSGGAEAVRAAAEACAAAPHSRALRSLRLELARRHLPADAHLAELRDFIAKATCPQLKLELWVWLLCALSSSSACSAPALFAAARAALHAVRAPHTAYPRLLYVYGAFLRSGGLWEQLLLLLELALGASLPPARAFPPAADPAQDQLERALLAAEDAALASGMPASALWVRVERARAAAHWRADGAAARASADPQRAPLPADVAELLQPLCEPRALFLLLATALRLVKVPLLPAAGWLRGAADGAAADALRGAGWAAHGGEALLPLLRAARRLPPAHPARAARPGALAHYLQPPHYCTNSGFSTWVERLWEAALDWTAGRQREALLCWRLRWLHALAVLVDGQEEAGRAELRRLRAAARAGLKRHAGGAALPFAQFARLELAAGDGAAAERIALRTLRAAIAHQSADAPTRLYVARVLGELGPPGGAAGRWALCCAALRRALPPDAALQRAPPDDVLEAARNECEQRCSELERALPAAAAGEEDLCAALLPGAAEWASARALLAPAARRQELQRALLAAADCERGAERRWREQSACALAVAAARDARALRCARELAPLHPDNGFLALAAEGGPLPAWPRSDVSALARALPARSDVSALARALPALLAAHPADWSPLEAERVYRVVARAAAGGCGGALLQLARLEAGARRGRPAPAAALYRALDAAPHCKALHVAGAAWVPREARALADALLDKQLRLHALPDELQPLAPPPPPLGEEHLRGRAPDNDTAVTRII